MAEPTPDSDDSVFLAFDEPDGDRSVVLEDDGEVAYAYLLVDQKIVSHVWLYDGDSPNARVPRLSAGCAVTCVWSATDVAIEMEGVLVARLRAGAKPGWSLGASRASPVALPLAMFPRCPDLDS